MKTLNEIISNNETQTRRNAIAFAAANNYKVSAMYQEAKEKNFSLMSAIHANGKEGNYDLAIQLRVVAETLQTWS